MRYLPRYSDQWTLVGFRLFSRKNVAYTKITSLETDVQNTTADTKSASKLKTVSPRHLVECFFLRKKFESCLVGTSTSEFASVFPGSFVVVFCHLAGAWDTRSTTVLGTGLGWASSGVHFLGATIFTTSGGLTGNGCDNSSLFEFKNNKADMDGPGWTSVRGRLYVRVLVHINNF